MPIANANNNNDFSNLIYIIRGVKVMLDADLAAIYGYSTKAFNQQVKNNIEKFDDDFRFKLTKTEYDEVLRSKILTAKQIATNSLSYKNEVDMDLRSKFLTANDVLPTISKLSSKSRTMPFAYTEQGIYMLMTVLKGDLATNQSKALIRTFKGMKDFIIENRSLVGNRELLQLSVQTTQNTDDIAKIKNTMVTRKDLAKVIQDFTDPMTRREYLILNGESFEANIAYSTIYQAAKKSVFIFDNYIGIKTLSLLKNVSEHIPVTIFSDNNGRGLHQTDFMDFCRQYPNHRISFIKTCGLIHDRYIVLDYNTKHERIFHCGASSKDAGNKVTTISEVADRHVYHQLIDTQLLNPSLSLT